MFGFAPQLRNFPELKCRTGLACGADRRAFTLLELILVVAVLVAAAALAVPTVRGSLSRTTLDKSAERVRVAMGQARVRAIREGEVQALFFVESGSWFQVAPFSQASQQASLASRREQVAQERRHSNLEEDLLAPGVRFAVGQVPLDDRAAETLNTEKTTSSVRPILFYPDGTAQDARILLHSESGAYVEIQLRGLTGLTSAIRLNGEPSRQ